MYSFQRPNSFEFSKTSIALREILQYFIFKFGKVVKNPSCVAFSKSTRVFLEKILNYIFHTIFVCM